jgi:hypothetical protein
VFQKPSAAMMGALRDFGFRHEVFIEAREFDDGLIFTRLPRRGSNRVGPRHHFDVSFDGRNAASSSSACHVDPTMRAFAS